MIFMLPPLLKTKLHIPVAREKIVSRGNLFASLNKGIHRKVTLVAAPAGFGKTTFISSWLQHNPHPVVWLSLGEEENDPSLFWAYMITGFQKALRKKTTSLNHLDSTQLPPPRTILLNLINDLSELENQFILVLDDYHSISNPQIHEALTFLIENQPKQLHIIFITRADPPLPMARLRGYGELNEFRTEDLRFSIEEASSYLNELMALDLLQDDIQQLEEHTEGWIIGLQLAALSLRNQSDKRKSVADFSGRHHYILDYLVEEVITSLPEKLRKFLLHTSILHRINADLAMRVTDSVKCEEYLNYLQEHNLFTISMDPELQWFRYHHLFRDLLVNDLKKTCSTDEIEALYQRASLWHQEQGNSEDAIQYALEGKLFDRAAELIESIADSMIAAGRIKTLIEWLKLIPSEVSESHPALLMHQGWIIFLTGQVNAANESLRQAKTILGQNNITENDLLLSGRIDALLSTIVSLTRNLPEAIQQAECALENLPETDHVYRARALRAAGVSRGMMGSLNQAIDNLILAKEQAKLGKNKFLTAEIISQIANFHKHQGKLSLAEQEYHSIFSLYSRPDDYPPASLAYIGLAEIALERNQLDIARSYLERGITLCEQGGIGYALQPAYLISGLVHHALGDKAAAIEAMKQGQALSQRGGGSLESILGLATFHTRLLLLLEDADEAQKWISGKNLPAPWSFADLPTTLNEKHLSLQAQVHLAKREYQEVLSICDAILPFAESSGRNARVIELNLFKAVALAGQGQPSASQEALTKALRHAEPCGYIQIFYELRSAIIPLLQTAQEEGRYPKYINKILTALGKNNAGSFQQGLVDPLTQRELDVLQLMCQGYSNQAIAEQLIVSVNTVKKHTSNIYSKLGVRNRAQAVLKAKEIDLVN